jgi:hypothetical protein
VNIEAVFGYIAAAMKRLRAHRIMFHGLPKNAVIMLLEVGCTEDGSVLLSECRRGW